MTTLALKDVPDDLYGRLEKMASARRRSVNDEALFALKMGLDREESSTISDNPKSVVEILDSLERFRNSIVLPPGTPSTVEMLREDRDR